MIDKTLCENPWLSLKEIIAPEKGINGYVYSHETRCAGVIIAILPYKKINKGYQFLLKSEVTPCWDTDQPILSSLTGGFEEGIKKDAVRELKEEAGYTIKENELINLGQSKASKSSDTIYSLFSVDLTDKIQEEALGDGSRLESESQSVWVNAEKILKVVDPQASVMLLRLTNKLI